MNKIIVFGGAFNPPLNSHFSLSEQLINEFDNIEKIIFVPVNAKYQKSETVIENEHRFNMLKLICDKNEHFEVSGIELKSDRPLYTIETLNFMQEKYPNSEILFLTGTDNLREFHTWHNPEEIMAKFKVLILERDNDCMDNIIVSNAFLSENKERFIKVNESIRTNLSSSFVREKIRTGKSIRYLTPDEVYKYIKENKLYEVM